MDSVFVAISFAVVILSTIFVSGYVVGNSMYDTLTDGDRYIVWSLFYEPKQGDIIIFEPEGASKDNKIWVKRIIAVGGQTVDIHDGKVYIDGVEAYEPYLDEETYKTGDIEFPYTVEEGYVFLMGDNRDGSTDSRIIGAVDKNRIIGKLIFRFYSPSGLPTGAVD